MIYTKINFKHFSNFLKKFNQTHFIFEILSFRYVLGGALLFGKYESWDVLNGSYFCFISLSTIGFGDLVPGDKIYSSSEGFDIELSFIFCSMYLMLGMALIAMCFNLMQEEVIHKFRTTVSTLKYICNCKKKRRRDYSIEM